MGAWSLTMVSTSRHDRSLRIPVLVVKNRPIVRLILLDELHFLIIKLIIELHVLAKLSFLLSFLWGT